MGARCRVQTASASRVADWTDRRPRQSGGRIRTDRGRCAQRNRDDVSFRVNRRNRLHVVQLPIAAISRCRSVSVRNAARSASVVRIVSIGERRDHQSARPIDGIDLSAPLGSSRRGFWDKNIDADVLRLAGAGARTVFHVGAHHGGEASAYLKLFPDAWIHCFEPSPAAFRILHERLGGSDRIGTSNLLEQVRPALIVEVSAAALATCVSTPQRVFDLLNQTRYRCHTRSPGRSSFQSSRVMPSVTEISLRSRGNVRSPESCPR
jgi:hypothetical protein